jgi:hypothetical protein
MCLLEKEVEEIITFMFFQVSYLDKIGLLIKRPYYNLFHKTRRCQKLIIQYRNLVRRT